MKSLVDNDLLLEIMEAREEVDNASSDNELRPLLKQCQKQQSELCVELEQAFQEGRIDDAKYQAANGADCIMMFDSWGGQLPPKIWEAWSLPYIKRIVQSFKAEYPDVPVTLYANGSGGLLERMTTSGVDVVGLDWTVDIADARARLGPNMSVQGNVDPAVLFASQDAIEAAVKDCLQSAGPTGHVLNLGHGVLVGTPEENVAYMFDLAKNYKY